MTPLLAVHAGVTFALIGLIWTVQLVLYPLFASVGEGNFPDYHASHMRRITLIVLPLMALEAGTAAVLLVHGARQLWFLASLGPLAFVWLSTAIVQVPLHAKLALGFDADVHRKLMRSNAWRVLAWSLRGLCLLATIS